MCESVSNTRRRVFALAFALSLPIALNAQTAPAITGAPSDYVSSKWDIGMEYSYLMPKGTVDTLIPDGRVLNVGYDNVPVGGIGSFSYYFLRNVGVQAEVGVHEWGWQNTPDIPETGTEANNDGFLTVSGGVIARFPIGRITPFVHALAGGVMIDGPVHNPFTWGPNLTAGGGMDIGTGWLHRRLAIRLFQVDYEYMHADFGTGLWGGVANVNALRFSTGIVIHGGHIAPLESLTLACSASPNSVYPGDPVSVTAMATGLDPKQSVVYSWNGIGVTGSGSTASVATAALAPGTYKVNCAVKEGKPGKEGLKPWQMAESSDSFTVKAFDPPTASCSANPSTIRPGESSNITAMGMSPQNRPLLYSYSAPLGTVTGYGATAVYSSNGAPTGTAGITCIVQDDKGQTATAMAMVTITAPYVAPVPHAQTLCSLSFAKDDKRPTRVDNESKACLDEIALDLQKQSDARAVVVGNSTAAEKVLPKHAAKNAKLKDLAAQRAVNAKAYLVGEKGIDSARIGVGEGTADAKSVENYLVPSGANFAADVTGTTPVDQVTVKAEERKPLGAKSVARKHALKRRAAKKAN